MKKEKVFEGSLKDLAEAMGVDYQVLMMKRKIFNVIRAECKKKKISQRKLAAMVPGMSQDRISDMYSSIGAGMTLDKIIDVAHALEITVKFTLKAA